MEFICSSLSCEVEKPVDYCKECSHSNWIVKGKTTFNPRFGFSSVYYYKAYDKWLEEFEKIDINEASFKLFD